MALDHPLSPCGSTYIDRLFEADGIRVSQALERTVNDLSNPPYTRLQLSSALDLHGAKLTAHHVRQG